MYIQYVGFDVAVSSRVYKFHVIDTHEVREFTVSVQSEAFRAARLKLQDGPAVCFARLRRELDGETPESRVVENKLSIEEHDIREILRTAPSAPAARTKNRVPPFDRAEQTTDRQALPSTK